MSTGEALVYIVATIAPIAAMVLMVWLVSR